MVTHDRRMVSFTDRTMEIVDGRLKGAVAVAG